jgi:PPOX class probable F420-dependent enzyme
MPDGTPQLTPVLVDTDGQTVVFNTAKTRVKYLNLQRNPAIAVCVVDRDNIYRWRSVRGRAQLIEEGADEDLDRLCEEVHGRGQVPTPELFPGRAGDCESTYATQGRGPVWPSP